MATRRQILQALPAHRFAHFSCHGLESPLDPRQAGIFLQDGLLSVRDIAAARFTGEFAFLSACKTAVGVARLPDEAMSLAAALHYTGFRHVVATQWSVYDSIASDVSRLFYREAIVDGSG
jgi:CHAT domain-containing protein